MLRKQIVHDRCKRVALKRVDVFKSHFQAGFMGFPEEPVQVSAVLSRTAQPEVQDRHVAASIGRCNLLNAGYHDAGTSIEKIPQAAGMDCIEISVIVGFLGEIVLLHVDYDEDLGYHYHTMK